MLRRTSTRTPVSEMSGGLTYDLATLQGGIDTVSDPSSLVPLQTVATLRARYGEQVNPWLDALPARLVRLQKEWGLAHLHAHPGAGSSYVAASTQAGVSVVLKLSPSTKGLEREAAALRHWGPTGATPTVRASEEGAVLLERVLPGTPLRQVQTEQAGTVSYAGAHYGAGARSVRHDTEYDKAVLHCLAQLSSAGAPKQSVWPELAVVLERRLSRYQVMLQTQPGIDPCGVEELVLPALARVRRLAGARTRSVLLHADLHPGNVLTDGARGVPTVRAVDPTPCVGDPAYDVAGWAARAGVAELEARLVRGSSVLGHPAERIWNWAAVAAVDHACTMTLQRSGSLEEVEALLTWARKELRY